MRWILDLLVSVLDEMVSIQGRLSNKESAVEALQVADSLQSPAIMVILCSSTRALLRFTFEFIKVYFGKIGQIAPTNIHQKARIVEITFAFQSLPYKIGYFESMFHEVETGVRAAYTQAALTTAQRSHIESAMFVQAKVPEVLHALVSKLMCNTLINLQDKVDMSRLFFYDTSWLGLQGAYEPRPRYDVLTKTPLLPGTKLRVCRRCGSLMKDHTAGEAVVNLQPWVFSGQKTCICLTYWNMA